jgi:hypothetical protein
MSAESANSTPLTFTRKFYVLLNEAVNCSDYLEPLIDKRLPMEFTRGMIVTGREKNMFQSILSTINPHG